MSKVVKGTKDARNFQVVKGPKDVRQIRCTKCKDLAVQVPDGTGGYVYKCTSCGSKFKIASMG